MARGVRNRLITGILDREIERTSRTYLRGRIVDIGCGRKPYARFMPAAVVAHVGVDHEASPHGTGAVDIVASAYAIPVEDESFDGALATSVLEHLEEPEEALREWYRILRPGAYIILELPHMWHLHEEPRDFYRFTNHGIRYLLEKVRFEVVELEALTGFWATGAQSLAYYLDRGNRGWLRRLRIIDAVNVGIQGAGSRLDHLDKAEQWTSLYLVVARKPDLGPQGDLNDPPASVDTHPD